jgi:hypothetical protein
MARFLSLATSFTIGGIFALYGCDICEGNVFVWEGQFEEMAGILMRRNWSVIRVQWMFTPVSCVDDIVR